MTEDDITGLSYLDSINNSPNHNVLSALVPSYYGNIVVGKSEKPLLVVSDDCIKFYTTEGIEIIVDKDEDLKFAMEYLIRASFGISLSEYRQKIRKEMFDEIVDMVGERNERILKMVQLFNEKNNHKR